MYMKLGTEFVFGAEGVSSTHLKGRIVRDGRTAVTPPEARDLTGILMKKSQD